MSNSYDHRPAAATHCGTNRPNRRTRWFRGTMSTRRFSPTVREEPIGRPAQLSGCDTKDRPRSFGGHANRRACEHAGDPRLVRLTFRVLVVECSDQDDGKAPPPRAPNNRLRISPSSSATAMRRAQFLSEQRLRVTGETRAPFLMTLQGSIGRTTKMPSSLAGETPASPPLTRGHFAPATDHVEPLSLQCRSLKGWRHQFREGARCYAFWAHCP